MPTVLLMVGVGRSRSRADIDSFRDVGSGILAGMSAYSSDPDLAVNDASGNGVELDVAVNLLDGTVRLSVLWTHEIYLMPEDAEETARALLRAAERGREAAQARR